MENEILSIDNIMSTQEAEALFMPEEVEDSKESQSSEDLEKSKTPIEVDTDTLFESPESVDSGVKNTQEQENANSTEVEDSPKNVIYSSIATTLKEEGILSELADEDLKSITTIEDFIEVFEKQVSAQLDDKYKRIDEALNSGTEPDDIKKYESTIQYLNTIKENHIKDESEEGVKLRKNLIFQSFINEGMSEDKASKLTERSFTTGADIEDALEALDTNKKQFQEEYTALIENNKNILKKEQEELNKQAEKFKKEIFESKDLFDGIPLDKATRQKIYDNISKPVYRDKDGYSYTAIQKYELENREEFLKKLGIIYTLTDGFKTIDKLVQNKVKKETKKSLSELEHTLNNTSRTSGGALNYFSGAAGEDSVQHSNIKLDLDI